MLINTFVNSVFVYDDRINFYFNYKDDVKSFKRNDTDSLSDLDSFTPPKKEHFFMKCFRLLTKFNPRGLGFVFFCTKGEKNGIIEAEKG